MLLKPRQQKSLFYLILANKTVDKRVFLWYSFITIKDKLVKDGNEHPSPLERIYMSQGVELPFGLILIKTPEGHINMVEMESGASATLSENRPYNRPWGTIRSLRKEVKDELQRLGRSAVAEIEIGVDDVDAFAQQWATYTYYNYYYVQTKSREQSRKIISGIL